MQLREIEIENFRGIKKLVVPLNTNTIFIGENNTGKTSVLHALRYCLSWIRSKKGMNFNEYDFYLHDENTEPQNADKISIKLKFSISISLNCILRPYLH